jgi:hypothetical protein
MSALTKVMRLIASGEMTKVSSADKKEHRLHQIVIRHHTKELAKHKPGSIKHDFHHGTIEKYKAKIKAISDKYHPKVWAEATK